MTQQKYSFQYCQKLVVFSEDWNNIFLARRRDEADYDGTFALIGGKMEITDLSIVDGLRREKNEEIGETAKVQVYSAATHNLLYVKKDGNYMILPHYLAHYVGGEIKLNPKEYSEYVWVPLNEVQSFQPKIENIPEVVEWALKLRQYTKPNEFVEI